METLQAQLTERDKRITQLQEKLRASTRTAWVQERAECEARIRGLEIENNQLRDDAAAMRGRATPNAQQAPMSLKVVDNEEEAITMPKSQVQAAEKLFHGVKEELECKKRECAEMSAHLKNTKIVTTVDVSEAQVLRQWEQLGVAIKDLSLKRFSQPAIKKPLDDQEREDFKRLSTHYRAYLSEPNMACFLFSAMLWRHLYHRLFHRVGRCWGERVHQNYSAMSAPLTGTGKVTAREYLLWRVFTARLLHACYEIDDEVTTAVTDKVYSTMWRFATGPETPELRGAIREVVLKGQELSAAFARSNIIPLVSNRPESSETQGFKLDERTMEMVGKCGKGGIVDMMISPCLLKRDDSDEFQLLVKADVIC